MTSEFTLEQARQLHDSNQIIDFEWAWQVLGYSRKDSAKRILARLFDKDIDYFIKVCGQQSVGRSIEYICITKSCFEKMQVIKGKTPKAKNLSEQLICKRLQKMEGGRKEVSTEAGKIDLLTTTDIIEVKEISRWKEAVGQILVLSAYFPNHRKRIHLFGCCDSSYLAVIEKHCQRLAITVTHQLLIK